MRVTRSTQAGETPRVSHESSVRGVVPRREIQNGVISDLDRPAKRSARVRREKALIAERAFPTHLSSRHPHVLRARASFTGDPEHRRGVLGRAPDPTERAKEASRSRHDVPLLLYPEQHVVHDSVRGGEPPGSETRASRAPHHRLDARGARAPAPRVLRGARDHRATGHAVSRRRRGGPRRRRGHARGLRFGSGREETAVGESSDPTSKDAQLLRGHDGDRRRAVQSVD